LNKWESKFPSFTSQRFIYEDLFDKDDVYKSKIEKLPAQEVEELKKSLGADFYYDKSVFAKKDLLEFDEFGFSLKIHGHDPDIERFVNQDGIVQIGDSIFEYKNNFIRIIPDGDYSKLSELKHLDKSSREKNILVIEIKKTTLNLEQDGNLRLNFSGSTECKGYTSGGGQRVIGKTVIGEKIMVDYMANTPYPGQTVFQPYAYLEAENQIDNVFGWSKKRTTALRIVGTNINFAINYDTGTNISFDKTTNGDLKDYISHNIYYTTNWWPKTGVTPLSMYGNATFYGRDNTWCSR